MNLSIKSLDVELEKLLLDTGYEYNFPKVLPKMMFILLISDKEISMEELAKRTKYSLATLSNTIKFAEEIDFIERVPYPKTKRIYVRAKHTFYDLIKISLKKQYDSFTPKISKLDEIESKYKSIKNNKIHKRIQLINDIKKMNHKINKINSILEEEG